MWGKCFSSASRRSMTLQEAAWGSTGPAIPRAREGMGHHRNPICACTHTYASIPLSPLRQLVQAAVGISGRWPGQALSISMMARPRISPCLSASYTAAAASRGCRLCTAPDTLIWPLAARARMVGRSSLARAP